MMPIFVVVHDFAEFTLMRHGNRFYAEGGCSRDQIDLKYVNWASKADREWAAWAAADERVATDFLEYFPEVE